MRSASLERSHALVITEGNFSATSFSNASRLPQIITVLFSRINLSVNPKQIPLAPPGIRILLFANFIFYFFEFYAANVLSNYFKNYQSNILPYSVIHFEF